MRLKLIFDLLEYPLATTTTGDLVVFGDRKSVKRVPLRDKGYLVRDLAVKQGDLPWLLTDQEWYFLGEHGSRGLVFDIERYGRPISGYEFYPSAVDIHTSSDRRILGLNTSKGFWLLELTGHDLRQWWTDPLPFLACSAWEDDGGVVLAGMSSRATHPSRSEHKYAPGSPTLLRLDKANDSWQQVPVPLAGRDVQTWPIGLVPESCLLRTAAEQGHLILVSLISVRNEAEPLDELPRFPMNSDVMGVLFLEDKSFAPRGEHLDANILSSLPMSDTTLTFAGSNSGSGSTVGSLVCIKSFASRPQVESQPLVLENLAKGLICSSFRVRHHPNIGYSALAKTYPGDDKATATILQSDDAVTWRNLGPLQALETVELDRAALAGG